MDTVWDPGAVTSIGRGYSALLLTKNLTGVWQCGKLFGSLPFAVKAGFQGVLARLVKDSSHILVGGKGSDLFGCDQGTRSSDSSRRYFADASGDVR